MNRKPPAPPTPPSLGTYPNITDWLSFGRDDTVAVTSGRVELGQGVSTAIAQIAADELDVAPGRITLTAGDTRATPNEGFTAGSMSIQMGGRAVRLAASAARALLLAEAAKLLQASPQDLTVEDGLVHIKGRPSDLDYWKLAETVDLTREIAANAAPKPGNARTLIGTTVNRVDLPAKVTGRPAFIHDLELDGMLHGRVVHPPSYTAKLDALDEDKIKANPDVLEFVRDGSFIGVIAEREDAALRAVAKLEAAAKWGPCAETPPDAVAWLKDAKGEPDEPLTVGDDPADIDGKRFATAVSRPYIAHASIGGSCAIAQWLDGRLIVHTHSQGVYQLREALVMALDMSEDKIDVIHMPGAGCYGHNGADDAAFDAVLLARAANGRPVRVVWSRASELAASPLGPAMVTRAEATLDADNNIVGFTTDVTSQIHGRRPGRGSPNLLAAEYTATPNPSTWRKDVPAQNGGGADRNAAPGYAIPNIRATKWLVHDLAHRASSLRGLGAFCNVYAIETLMDDIADELGEDPVKFRLRHLDDERGAAVVKRVAEMSGWPGKTEEGAALGLGYARYKGASAYCAVAVRVELDEEVRVTHAWAAAEAGEAINPGGMANQVEGGLIQSISWTLKERMTFEDGAAMGLDWETYPILRFDEVPALEVEIIDRPDLPSLGVGECAQGPTAAAIGNAVFRAIGARIRDLPIDRDAIVKALT